MKIVHELNQLDFGGVERVIKNIIKYDKKNEHTIVAYKDGKFRPELEKVGAKIILLEKETDQADLSADIVHVHTGGSESRMALEVGKELKVIETIHSPVRSAMTNEYIYQRVGVSNAVSELNHNCITIKNGLDFEEFQPTKTIDQIRAIHGIPEGIPIVGRLGRLGKDKGLEEWILACSYLQQEGYEFIPMIVGGQARDAYTYQAKLKLMCASLPLRNVVWVGNQTETANYYQIMDVFLYPSPTEGFGLVFAEAMYAGAVVVGWDTKVTKELFGGYAILTEKTIPALVQGLKKALTTEVQDALSGISRDFIESEYNAERMSLEYQELYERSN